MQGLDLERAPGFTILFMKQTYTIKEVSAQTGMSIDTLRYYERCGLIHSVERLPNTHRRYRASDIEWIAFLRKLRATGMSIQQILPYAQLQRLGSLTVEECIALLKSHQQRLETQMQEMQGYLRLITTKITYYERLLTIEEERSPN